MSMYEDLANYLLGERLPIDIVEAQTGELLIPANYKITKSLLMKVVRSWKHIEIDPSPIRNRVLEIIFKYDTKLDELEKQLS